MARLRNRIRKAEFFTDGELLRWPRDKRTTYSGLWALAEDSGCLEDDPFEWKLQLWASPLDSDITPDVLAQWRDELIEAGKLIPYECEGKRYLFIRTFHQHETPRNPQPADLPLPLWVKWDRTVVKRGDSHYTRNAYCVDTETVPSRNSDGTVEEPTAEKSLQNEGGAQYGDNTVTVRSSQSSPVQHTKRREGAPYSAPSSESRLCELARQSVPEWRPRDNDAQRFAELLATWSEDQIADTLRRIAAHQATAGQPFKDPRVALGKWLKRVKAAPKPKTAADLSWQQRYCLAWFAGEGWRTDLEGDPEEAEGIRYRAAAREFTKDDVVAGRAP